MLAQGGAMASTARYGPGQKEAGQDSIFGEEEEETDALAPYPSPFQAARCGSVGAVHNTVQSWPHAPASSRLPGAAALSVLFRLQTLSFRVWKLAAL